MFGIGMPELVLIFIVALLVFGPKRLPDLGKSVGRALREFKRASDELKDEIGGELSLEVEESPQPSRSQPSSETPSTTADSKVAETAAKDSPPDA